MFETTNPFQGLGRDAPVGDVLDRAARRVATKMRDQPEVRAALTNIMGRVYYDLGVYDKAAELVQDALTYRQRTLGGDNPLFANSLNSLGAITLEQGAHSDARRKPSHH